MREIKTGELEFKTNVAEWGKWARGGMPSGIRGDGAVPFITDDEALLIDGVIAGMFGRPRFVLLEIYIHNRSIAWIAEHVNESSRKIMAWRDMGLNMLYGAMFLGEEVEGDKPDPEYYKNTIK